MARSRRFFLLLLCSVIVMSACQARTEPAPPADLLSAGAPASVLQKSTVPQGEGGAYAQAEKEEQLQTEAPPRPLPGPAAPVLPGTGNDPTPSPGPSPTPPPAAPPVVLPPGVHGMVLLGSDQFAPNNNAAGGRFGRTDTLQLLFWSERQAAASLVSIPRDLYVYQPGRGMERINLALSLGGIDLLYGTLEYNLGIRPEHYALAHLDDFIYFVDDLGGIDVPVSTPLPDDCGGVPEGVFHMNGVTALCYVRSRFSTSDIDRSRRQQEVLAVLLDRVVSFDVAARLPEWYARYSNTLQSDLGLADLLALAPLAVHMRSSRNLHAYQIGWDEVSGYTVPETGAAVLLPQTEKILPLLQAAANALEAPAPILPGQKTP